MEAAWIAVIGVLGGSALTLVGNIINNRYLIRKERESRKWELEKLTLERNNKQLSDMFKVYNAVLKEDGEHQYVSQNDENILESMSFDRIRYKEVIRPILLTDIHLLSEGVFKLVRKLDSYTYDDLNYIDPDEWHNEMVGIYKELIAEIESEYNKRV